MPYWRVSRREGFGDGRTSSGRCATRQRIGPSEGDRQSRALPSRSLRGTDWSRAMMRASNRDVLGTPTRRNVARLQPPAGAPPAGHSVISRNSGPRALLDTDWWRAAERRSCVRGASWHVNRSAVWRPVSATNAPPARALLAWIDCRHSCDAALAMRSRRRRLGPRETSLRTSDVRSDRRDRAVADRCGGRRMLDGRGELASSRPPASLDDVSIPATAAHQATHRGRPVTRKICVSPPRSNWRAVHAVAIGQGPVDEAISKRRWAYARPLASVPAR